MSLVANTYLGVLAYRGEERRNIQVHMVGLLRMMMQQQYVRGRRWFGTAAAVVVVLPYYPPVLVCTWHMMR